MLFILVTILVAGQTVSSQQTVSFSTSDGGLLYADLYGANDHNSEDRGVVLAHGGQFHKESWAPQARTLAAAGYRVLAIDFRGFGKSHGPGEKDFFKAPFQLDVLAAADYLRSLGVRHLFLIGGSFGGSAVGDASIAKPGDFEGIVMLAGSPNEPAEKLHSASLWIVARDDANDDGPRLPRIREQFMKAPEPKKLVILDGSAHAQFLFKTDQADQVMQEILAFLRAKSSK